MSFTLELTNRYRRYIYRYEILDSHIVFLLSRIIFTYSESRNGAGQFSVGGLAWEADSPVKLIVNLDYIIVKTTDSPHAHT